MTDKEITREHNPINRIEVFKKRTDDFFATYENSSGSEDGLEICLIRDGCRAVSQAEEIINRLQEENEELVGNIDRLKNAYKQVAWERDIFAEDMKEEIKKDCSYLMLDIQTIKAEAYKEFAEQLDAEIESSDKYIREYDDSEVQKAYNKGLRDALKVLKELVGE